MTGDRRPKGVDIDKPGGYGKLKLRRWRRRKERVSGPQSKRRHADDVGDGERPR